MKLIKFYILTLLLFSTSGQTFAVTWSKVGNAGFVIDCDGQVELFDFYEAKDKFTFYKPQGETVRQKVNYYLNKLESLDPNRAKNYRYQFNNYWTQNMVEHKFRSIFQLDHLEVQDKDYQKDYGIGQITIPKNCVLKLALQQIAPEYKNGDRRGFLKVEVYNKLWDQLSNDLKASLVIHELFYRENILLRYDFRSTGVRALTALLASKQYYKLTQQDWHKKLIQSGFRPMFPNFTPIISKNEIDLETDSGNWDGFKTWAYAKPILIGTIVFSKTQNLKVHSHSPFYFKGFYPEYFSLAEIQVVDISHLTDRPLKIIVPPNCLFRLSNKKAKSGFGQKLISLGYDKENLPIENCEAIIDNSYSHELIDKLENPKTLLLFDKFAKIPKLMTVERIEGFSKLKLKIGGQVHKVNSFKVNLENGNIFDIKIRNFVEKIPN